MEPGDTTFELTPRYAPVGPPRLNLRFELPDAVAGREAEFHQLVLKVRSHMHRMHAFWYASADSDGRRPKLIGGRRTELEPGAVLFVSLSFALGEKVDEATMANHASGFLTFFERAASQAALA